MKFTSKKNSLKTFFLNKIFYPLQKEPPKSYYIFAKNESKYLGLIFKREPFFLILVKLDM